MKKVVKGNKSNNDTPQKVLPGKPVKLVVPTKNFFWTCPVCSTQRTSGMLYQDNGINYCSRKCVISASN
jgi:hypothetical protein